MIIFWLIILAGIILLVKRSTGHGCSWHGQEKDAKNPTDILKERYAKGEIDKEKFEGMKKDLEIK